ncbi:MAG: zinc ribbon domain-containing protein [Defluviitaleaceae bacterium]|nr:zinc ribbon domain-containing protein [Defluviitaleaceae bacterium]
MSFCNSCGTQLEPNVAFCAKCGNKTEGTASAPAPQPAPQAGGVTANPNPAVDKIKNLAGGLNAGMAKGLIMALAVVLAALTFSAWLTFAQDRIMPNAERVRFYPHSFSSPVMREHNAWEQNQTNPNTIQNRRDAIAPIRGLNTVATIQLVVGIISVAALAAFMLLSSQKHQHTVNAALAGFGLSALMTIVFIIYILANGSDIGAWFGGALTSARPSFFAIASLLVSIGGFVLTFLKKSELNN